MTQSITPHHARVGQRPRVGAARSTPFWSMTSDAVASYVAANPGPIGTAGPSAGRSRAAADFRILGRQFASPITLILVVAALIAATTGDFTDGAIILGIVAASALLGAWQEGRAADVVTALLVQVSVTVRVERGGVELHLPVADVRPGDRLALDAGDVVPGDCLLLASRDLTVDESALTGESFPATKIAGPPLPASTPLAGRTNALFAGTHVISGTGDALVVLAGPDTTFGRLAAALGARLQPTSFAVGVRRFGLLLLRVMLVLVAAILVIDLLLHRPLVDSLLFALALAVGITPQMLPVVVTVSLSAGARRMARSAVIVKRLDVIEDLGSMSVLCTDKTGTITAGVVGVDRALDTVGDDSPRVLRLAALNAGLQTGSPTAIDAAITARAPVPSGATLLDEVPYDFARKRLSVAVVDDDVPVLITLGAVEAVLGCCTASAGRPLDRAATDAVRAQVRALGDQGLRVLGVATRALRPGERTIEASSEAGLDFVGVLALSDPVKSDAGASIAALAALGIAVKVISGDGRDVTASLAPQLGLTGRVVLGEELERADDDHLRHLVAEHSLFAEVEPMHKVKVVQALRSLGETVGFLGDGINDAGALRAADVGLSVQTAVDVAKEAASIVLTTQDLGVVASGVRLGRRTFANTLKYVRVAASSNFGNILSMVVAAALLPFLPMLPAQILLLNFLADIPNTLVSRDRVDPERVAVAGVWDMRAITRFMIVFGAVSTVFDLITFAILEWGLHAHAGPFRSAWFFESALTQLVAMMTLRTGRPAWRSRPDPLFLGVSAGVAIITCVLPFTAVGSALGFVPLPVPLLAVLIAVAAVYGVAIEGVKRVVRF